MRFLSFSPVFSLWALAKASRKGPRPPCAPRARLSLVKTRQAPPFPHSGQRRVIRLVDAILFHFNVENPVESVENPPEKPLFGPIGAGFTQGFPHGVEKLSTKLRVEFWLSKACFDDFAGCFFVFFVHFFALCLRAGAARAILIFRRPSNCGRGGARPCCSRPHLRPWQTQRAGASWSCCAMAR